MFLFCLTNISLIHTSGTDSPAMCCSVSDRSNPPSLMIWQCICPICCFPHKGSCYSSVSLFPRCLWKMICTFVVSVQYVELLSGCHTELSIQVMIFGYIWPAYRYLRNIFFLSNPERTIHASDSLGTWCKELCWKIIHTIIIPSLLINRNDR